MEQITTDILVIGGGGAGSKAALTAKKNNPNLGVILATEGLFGFSGSTNLFASETFGINAPFNYENDGDNPEIYYKDMLETGLGLADKKLCRIIADESSRRITELIDLGLKLNSDNLGKIKQVKLSGCSKARSMSVDGRTGFEIVKVLRKAIYSIGVKVIEKCRFVDLISKDGRVYGGIFLKSGELLFIKSKAIILATGGAGGAFKYNVNSDASFGHYGYASALRAGAKLVNFEFIQIGPGVVFPPLKFIIHSYVWSFIPRLLNKRGENFLPSYLENNIRVEDVLYAKRFSYPFSCRTIAKYLDIAMFSEIMKGNGTNNGGIYLDITHVGIERLKKEAGVLYKTFKEVNFDISKEKLEIAPMVQSFNGGILIDEEAGTGVEGLFAAGEASGGVHGADRPGGNNLIDCQVFGFRAGISAAEYASKVGRNNSFMDSSLSKDYQVSAAIDKNESKNINDLKDIFSRNLSIVRDKKGLKKVIEKTEEIIEKNRKETTNPLLESYPMALVGNAIAKAALLREESRGVHYREDFPSESDLLEKRILLELEGSEVVARFEK